MAKEFALVSVKNNDLNIEYRTSYFDENKVNEKHVVNEQLQIWFSGEEGFSDEKEELIRKLEEVERENQVKEAFLSNMSHDIRTPMNAIIGMTAIAKKHIDEKNRVADSLDKIEVASSHLLSLINEVLDISRINSGSMTITNNLFALSDLIHEVRTIVKPQADEKGHNLTLAIDDISYENLYGDILHLRQIYVNIISNSIKYTENNGNIIITLKERVEADRVWLIFNCKDNGIGMSEDFLKKVFTPFTRASSTTISKIEGTGLGMSIVKKLVDNMNGTIEIDSKVNEGTSVTIEIPMYYEDIKTDTSALKDKKLLIIENDRVLCGFYSKYLRERNISYDIALSYQEAMSAITDAEFNNAKYDLIVFGKPESVSAMLEMAGYIRKKDASIAMVLISDMDWSSIEYRANRAGINNFIPLPLLRTTLINGLNNIMMSGEKNTSAGDALDLSGRNVLLVEDNMINAMIATEILATTNCHVDHVDNGQKAVEKFMESKENYYSIILMDIQMPVMDGYQAAREIRACQRKDASEVKIYAMTANIFAEDIAKAREAGMDGHIAKPIDVKKLMRTLRQSF